MLSLCRSTNVYTVGKRELKKSGGGERLQNWREGGRGEIKSKGGSEKNNWQPLTINPFVFFCCEGNGGFMRGDVTYTCQIVLRVLG